MNKLTVKQRKMLYAILAVLLLIPIIGLGAPATRSASGQVNARSLLARSREEYDLGEASLGNVDPASATMNLVLLGMRGIAASVLWNQADEYKNKKQFFDLEKTVESIILLQPHFKNVWEFQAWNLAYNVSVECDAVEDRFFWVKRGAKFLNRGVNRNQHLPELPFNMGSFLSKKIGLADERDTFREFFMHDPDVERWNGGPDEEINPEHKDNYLVARDWFFRANQVLEQPNVEQHIMDLSLFVAYPYRALMDYARGLQKDGVKVDLSQLTPEQREAAYQEWANNVQASWDQAYDEWTNIYGRQRIPTAGGGGLIVLENDPEGLAELRQIAEEEEMPYYLKLDWQERYRKIASYPYWKKHADIEKRPLMTQARYNMAEGRRLYREVQDFEGAREHLARGMGQLDEVIQEYQVTDQMNLLIADEEEIVEEGIKALIIWRQVLTLLNEPIPDEYPLQRLWEQPELESLRQDLNEQFLRWQGNL